MSSDKLPTYNQNNHHNSDNIYCREWHWPQINFVAVGSVIQFHFQLLLTKSGSYITVLVRNCILTGKQWP